MEVKAHTLEDTLRGPFEELFSGNCKFPREGKPIRPKRPKPEFHLCAYDPDRIREVISLYQQGVDILSIGAMTCLVDEEVNLIIDAYAPYLGD